MPEVEKSCASVDKTKIGSVQYFLTHRHFEREGKKEFGQKGREGCRPNLLEVVDVLRLFGHMNAQCIGKGIGNGKVCTFPKCPFGK